METTDNRPRCCRISKSANHRQVAGRQMDLNTRTFPPVMFRQAPTQTVEQLTITYPTKRLTGFALLDHNKRGITTRAELIRAAGYTRLAKDGTERICYIAYYEALIAVKRYQSMVDIFNDAHVNPSNSVAIRSLILAIKQQNYYNYRTDSVSLTGLNFRHSHSKDALNIYHQNKLIAAVDFKSKVVVLRINEGSRSDKERLNRILMHFCGCNLFSRNKVWTIVKPFNDEKKVTGYWTEVPFLSTEYPG